MTVILVTIAIFMRTSARVVTADFALAVFRFTFIGFSLFTTLIFRIFILREYNLFFSVHINISDIFFVDAISSLKIFIIKAKANNIVVNFRDTIMRSILIKTTIQKRFEKLSFLFIGHCFWFLPSLFIIHRNFVHFFINNSVIRNSGIEILIFIICIRTRIFIFIIIIFQLFISER